MSTSERSPGERIVDVRFEADALTVSLVDGRTLSVPLSWFPRLAAASDAQLRNWQLCSGGHGIHWPEIDEDVSVEGLLRGAPAPSRGATTG